MVTFPVAILCGGYGTRLGDLTKNTQKCMVDVNGKPFLGHVLELLASQGIEQVVLCVGHLGEQVEEYVGDGRRFGFERMWYSWDGEQPIGTAGALSKALPLLGDKFWVLYGDSYLPADLYAIQTVYEYKQTLGLMVVCEPPAGYKPNVWYERGYIWSYDKRFRGDQFRHIDYGLGILDRRVFTSGSASLLADLSDVYTRLAMQSQLAGYLSTERFHTVGTLAGLQHTREYLSEHAILR